MKIDFKIVISLLFTGKYTATNNGEIYNITYNNISDEDKESLFFIVNRYMSKKYPKQAQFFNTHGTDKATAMDIWNMMIKKEKQIPFWFWKGAAKKKEPEIKDWKVLYEKLQDELSISDMFLLCELFPTEVKNEIKELLQIKKEREKL